MFSMMGVGPRKTGEDVTNQVYVMDLAHAKGSEGRQVPGVVGRANASAAGAKGLVILMGGFLADSQGGELTVPDVNVSEPAARRWSRGKDIPTPADSAVVGVTHARSISSIGGRSPRGPLNTRQ